LAKFQLFFRGVISNFVYDPPEKELKFGQNNPENLDRTSVLGQLLRADEKMRDFFQFFFCQIFDILEKVGENLAKEKSAKRSIL